MNSESCKAKSDKQGSSSRQKIWTLAGLSLAILMTVGSVGSAAIEAPGGVEPRLQITVRVYNYAGVAKWSLRSAEGDGTRIFRKAGVKLAWLECSVSPSPEGGVYPCETPLGAIALNLKILPPSMARRFTPSQEEMGFALVSAHAGRATEAWVYYQRVEDAAVGNVASPSQILACAMAHEIGHLLLGPDHHSREGIMCAHWNRRSLEAVAQGQMVFTRDQVKLIRDNVQTRAELAQVSITGQPSPREVAAIKGK